MNKLPILLFLATIVSCATVTKKDSNPTIDALINALNNHDYSIVAPYMSENFLKDKKTTESHHDLLVQMFTEYPFPIENYKIINENKTEKNTELIIEIKRKDKPAKNFKFTVNEKNQLLSIGLFVIDINETKVEVPKKIIDTKFFKTDFKLVDGIIIVEANLNNEVHNFIFDTGSPQLVLNRSVIDTTSDKNISVKGVAFQGKLNDISMTKIDKFQFGLFNEENFSAIALDLPLISKEIDMEIAGLIGYNEIKDYEIVIDYENKEMYGFKLDNKGEVLKKIHLGNKNRIIDFEMIQHLPIVKVSDLNRNIYDFAIDSGAAINLIDQKLQESMKHYYKKTGVDTLRSVENQQKEIEIGEIFRMKVGNYWFENMRTTFSDLSSFSNEYDLKIDGIIGYEFLHQNKIAINYKKKKIYLLN